MDVHSSTELRKSEIWSWVKHFLIWDWDSWVTHFLFLKDVEGYKAIWGSTLDHFEQLVRQIRCPGQADAMAGVLDPRNAKFDIKIAWTCPNRLDPRFLI